MTKKRLKELKKIADSGHDTHYCNLMKELLVEIEAMQGQIELLENDLAEARDQA